MFCIFLNVNIWFQLYIDSSLAASWNHPRTSWDIKAANICQLDHALHPQSVFINSSQPPEPQSPPWGWLSSLQRTHRISGFLYRTLCVWPTKNVPQGTFLKPGAFLFTLLSIAFQGMFFGSICSFFVFLSKQSVHTSTSATLSSELWLFCRNLY